MKQRISALMDGELEGREASAPLAALQSDGEASEAWRTYHLISDALRETRALSHGFAQRVAARLAEEPTVIAPGRRLAAQPAQTRWFALSAAASVAAVALVGWLAFAPQQGAGPAPRLAQTPQAPQPVARIPQPIVPAKAAAQVPPPEAANDYLLAHQGYSPRVSLQGMAPYVRTVSGEAARKKKP